jgi:hypothetical protein
MAIAVERGQKRKARRLSAAFFRSPAVLVATVVGGSALIVGLWRGQPPGVVKSPVWLA